MAWGVLREGPFRLLFAARAVSSLGDRLVPVALAFAVLELTGSVTDLGLVIAAQTTPLILLVLFGGVWADRLPRRLVMLGSDCVRAVAQAISAVLLLTGSAEIWQLMVLQAIYGAAEAFFGPASTAVVAQTVPTEQLQPANAMLGLADNAASIAGPALAGVIVSAASPGWGLAFDAATFLLSGAFLLALRIEPRDAAQAEHADRAARGLEAFSSRRWLWASVLFFTLYIALVYAPWQVLGPQVAREHLGGAAAWAAISASLGAGAVAGGLLGLRWRPRLPLRVAFLLFLATGPALLVLLGAHAPLAGDHPGGAARRRRGEPLQRLVVHGAADRGSRRGALEGLLLGLPRHAGLPAGRADRGRPGGGRPGRVDHALRRGGHRRAAGGGRPARAGGPQLQPP